MKKKLLLLASVALLFTGCRKEQFVEKNLGEGLQNVTFTVGVASEATKAVADNDGHAANVNHWIMQVLDSDGDVYNYQEKTGQTDLTNTFDVPLVKGQTYQVLFWADKEGNYVTVDKEKITDLRNVKRAEAVALVADRDDLDAFSAVVTDFSTTVATQQQIFLKRPFAQLNVVFTDLSNLYTTMGSNDTEYAKFKPADFVAKAKVPTTFNVLTQAASDLTDLEVEAEDCYNPSGEESNDNYTTHEAKATLYMDYIFASKDTKDIVDINFSFASKGVTIAHNFAAVPFQRNYRTNILGNLMSANAKWEVTVSPTWDSLNDGSKDYNVNYYEPSSITDAQEYIENNDNQKAKTVDLSKYTVTTDDFDTAHDAEDKTIKFELKTTSPADMVNFTLPEIPQEVIDAGCTGWKITYEPGYPTQNVNVTAPDETIVTIEAPNSHVTLNGNLYQQVTATTSQSTLVVPAGVTVETLVVKEGAVEIHGVVNNLTVSPAEGKKVLFRECEGLSAAVFAKIYSTVDPVCNYLDPMYTYELVGEKYNIYKLPVVAMIGEVEYPSLDTALAAVQANETIDVVAESVELPAISKDGITLKGNGSTKVTAFGGLTGKNVTLDGFEFTVQINPNAENFAIKNSKFTGNNGLRYAYAKGNVLIENCVFDTQTYGIHFDGTQPGKATVKGCQIVGFNTFNPELNFVDCNFVDSDKNQYYVAQAWSNVSFTNCTFSEKWCAVTDYQTIGIASGNGVATLNGCTTAIGTVVDACMNSAMTGVVAIDATGNATDGFTAGTFITGDAANIKVAQGYMAKAVEGKDNVWTVAVKPAAEFNGQEYASFEAALNAAKAAKGGKVTLVDDVTLTRTDYKGCSSSDEDFATRLYTIDLNGHKISGGLFAFEDCSYTIEDSVGGGSISRDGSCLQLNVSQFMASKMCTFETCPTFTVTGGEFIGTGNLDDPFNCKYGAQIGAQGTYDHKQAVSKFLISGGKIRNMRIYNGKGEISGGTFEGQLKIEVCTEGSDKYVSGVTYSDLVCTITGGTFNLAETNPIFGADYAKDRLGEHLQIKGGTFNFNPSVNYSDCIPGDYVCQDNYDGTWTVVEIN